MRRSHAQELLNRTVYAEDGNVQDHIKLLRTRRAAVDNLSDTPMKDETWRGILIRSIPPTSRWLPVIPSLYTLSSSADIVSTILAHSMILDRGNEGRPTTNSSNTALAATATNPCGNPNCKAKKRSSHTTANCYWPGGGKEGQFPPNFGQRAKANAARCTPNADGDHYVLSARVFRGDDHTVAPEILVEDIERSENGTTTPTTFVSKGFHSFGSEGVPTFLDSGASDNMFVLRDDSEGVPTFLDSGASDNMFVLRDDFVEYKATALRTGDSAKAVDGNFEIVGEGQVVQCYFVEGKEKKVTYTHALHTPHTQREPHLRECI
jgi:hypothetical protein